MQKEVIMRTVLHDYVVIKVDEYEKEVGGLYRAEQWKSLPPTGTVEAIGPEVTTVKVGDHVHFLRFAAVDGQTDKERVCKEKYILEVING